MLWKSCFSHVQEGKHSGLGNSKLCLGTGCRYSQARIYHHAWSLFCFFVFFFFMLCLYSINSSYLHIIYIYIVLCLNLYFFHDVVYILSRHINSSPLSLAINPTCFSCYHLGSKSWERVRLFLVNASFNVYIK